MTTPPDGPADLASVQLDADRRIARLTLALMLVPTVWFLRTDLSIALEQLLTPRFAVRSVFVGFLLAGIWGLRRPLPRASYERMILIVGMGAACCILALNALRPEGSTLPLRTPLMWLLAYYGGLHSRTLLQILPPLTVSLGLTWLRLTWVNSGESGTVDGDILVIWVLNAVGILMVRNRAALIASEWGLWDSRQRAHAATERAMAELRTLRGIIPICSYCREVRTDAGDWTRIESYVREHTDAEFSHGICPACAGKQFPAMAKGDAG